MFVPGRHCEIGGKNTKYAGINRNKRKKTATPQLIRCNLLFFLLHGNEQQKNAVTLTALYC